jgi:signal transduction histidine kinase/DNA-binding NarL/FixJ family response regulator
MVHFFAAVELISIIVTGMALFYLIKDEHSQEQKLMMFMLILSFCHNLGLFIEVNSTTVEGVMNATMVEYVGSSFYALGFLMFASLHCNKKLKNEVTWFFFGISALSVVAVWTNKYTHLYYSELKAVQDPNFHVTVKYGPLMPVFLFAIIVPYLLGIYKLIREAHGETEPHRRKTLIAIILMSLIPVCSMTIYMGTNLLMYDCTALITCWVTLISIFLFYQSKTFDVRRLATRSVLDIMDDGVITLDSNQNIMFVNQAAKRIFPELSELPKGANISAVTSFPRDVLSGQGKNDFEKDDNLYEIHLNVVRDSYDAIRGYAIMIFDQTEMYGFFDELMQMKEISDHASKAKSEFLTSLSFEIRTPMNSIMGLSEMILDQTKGGRGEELAKDLMISSTSLMTIINNLLDISKIEAGKMDLQETEYRSANVLKDVKSIMGYGAMDKGLDLIIQNADGIPEVMFGDVGKIRQVLSNLVSNAIRYTDEGYIKMKMGYNAISDERGELLFTIRDTSSSVKAEEIPVFFNALDPDSNIEDNVNESSGLGLVIIKNLLSLLGGTIDIKVGEQGGVISTIAIPQKAVTQPLREESNSEDFICPDVRILVVDDNKINLKVAVGLLSKYQFKIDEATSGAQAIEMVKETPYRIIFMDQMMPEMDGIEATRRIRSECGENGTNAIVIALTANAVKGAEEMFLQNGFEAFLAKPIDKIRLHELFKQYIPEELRIPTGPEEEEVTVAQEDLDKLAMNGVDVKDGLNRRRQSVNGYLELLELFYTDGLEKVMTIREYAEAKDYKNYEIEVHALKSAAANLGAGGLSDEAKEHEFAAKDGKNQFVDENYEVILRHYEDILSEVERVLALYGRVGKPEEDEDRPIITEQEVLNRVEEMLSLMEDFKPKDAAMKLEDLLRYSISPETRKVLMAIKTKLRLYDDDAAEQMLRELLEVLDL